MTELAQALIGDSYAAAPDHILDGITKDLAHRELPNAPHTIYDELWHLAFWQAITLDWLHGIETPFPAHPTDAFPPKISAVPEGPASSTPAPESFDQLRSRFLGAAQEAAAASSAVGALSIAVLLASGSPA